MSHSFTSEVPRTDRNGKSPLSSGRRSCPHLTHLYPGSQNLVWHSLTHTRAVVRSQLEAWLTLASKRAWQVHTSVLAIAVATLIYV